METRKVKLHEICGIDEPVKQLKVGSELYLCTAIAYCLRMLTNNTVALDVSNVSLHKSLYHTAYVDDCETMGLMFKNIKAARRVMSVIPYSANVKSTALSEYLLSERYGAPAVASALDTLYPSKLFDIPFETSEDDYFVVRTSTVSQAYGVNDPMRNIDAYVYIAAMVLVMGYISKLSHKLAIVDDSVPQHTEFCHLLCTTYMGARLLRNLEVKFVTTTDNLYAQKWAATLIERRQKGCMLPSVIYKYTTEDKIRWLKANDITVGSVLMLYFRVAGNNSVTHGVTNCYVCVVRKITDTGISVQYIDTLHTKETVYNTVTSLIKEGNTLYTDADKHRFVMGYKSYNFNDVGIGDCTNAETVIFMPLSDGVTHTTEQMLTVDDEIRTFTMGDIDLIYTVLCNREINFNRRQFVEKYFTGYGTKPMYDTIYGINSAEEGEKLE